MASKFKKISSDQPKIGITPGERSTGSMPYIIEKIIKNTANVLFRLLFFFKLHNKNCTINLGK